MSSVTLDFDTRLVAARRAPLFAQAQAALDVQIIKDSNLFCPEDTGELQQSAMRASAIGQGRVTWDTPYAREQYYMRPNKSKDKNPRATVRWFEVAKGLYCKDWLELVRGFFA